MQQGRPVNVKHGARCATGKVEDKNQKSGNFNVYIRGDRLAVFDNNGLNASSLLLCCGYF